MASENPSGIINFVSPYTRNCASQRAHYRANNSAEPFGQKNNREAKHLNRLSHQKSSLTANSVNKHVHQKDKSAERIQTDFSIKITNQPKRIPLNSLLS
jgi:hypothetical protein